MKLQGLVGALTTLSYSFRKLVMFAFLHLLPDPYSNDHGYSTCNIPHIHTTHTVTPPSHTHTHTPQSQSPASQLLPQDQRVTEPEGNCCTRSATHHLGRQGTVSAHTINRTFHVCYKDLFQLYRTISKYDFCCPINYTVIRYRTTTCYREAMLSLSCI